MTVLARRTVCLIVAQVALGVLALQPLAWVTALTWGRFAHVLFVAAGLGYLLWRERPGQPDPSPASLPDPPAATPAVAVPPGGSLAAVTALVLVYAANQFRPAVAAAADAPALGRAVAPWLARSAWLAPGAVGVAVVALAACGPAAWRWRRGDWTAVVLAVLAALAAAMPALVGGASRDLHLPWPAFGQVLLSLLVWLAGRRAVALAPRSGWRLAAWVWAVLAATAAAGIGQAAVARYATHRGDAARAAGDLPAATAHYARARQLAGRLGLHAIADRSAFALAGVLAAQDRPDEAAATLGLRPGFVHVIPADAWEGPEGGRLYYLASCWKDLVLYPGDIEIRIHAHGDPALGVWPLMRVKLGNKVLDDVFVDAKESKPFSFFVEEPVARRVRLELRFLNDFKQNTPPLDRNLWIDHAEIHYRRVAWP